MLKRLVGTLGLLMFLVGCHEAPVEKRIAVGENGFIVEKLFVVDGCAVSHFITDHPVYFVSCRGGTQYEQTSGKSTIHRAVPTEIQ